MLAAGVSRVVMGIDARRTAKHLESDLHHPAA
jgi:hypothetical protein